VLVSAPRRNELVLSGRGDKIVDLPKVIFFGRREGLQPLAIRYCRKLAEGAERFSRTLAELLRGRAKFSFARGDAQGKWFWLGSESH
jgi:hypothetical protein